MGVLVFQEKMFGVYLKIIANTTNASGGRCG